MWMAPVELAQLHAVLLGLGPRSGLEWGAGGSTRWVLEQIPTLERYVSVEHDEAWHARVAGELDDPRLVLHHVAPNVEPPFRTWRNRRERRSVLQWRLGCEHDPAWMADYVAHPRSLGLGPYDFVLVDGRARVFCIEEGYRLLRPGGVVVVHDGQRPEYAPVLDRLGAVRLNPWEQGQVVVVRKP